MKHLLVIYAVITVLCRASPQNTTALPINRTLERLHSNQTLEYSQIYAKLKDKHLNNSTPIPKTPVYSSAPPAPRDTQQLLQIAIRLVVFSLLLLLLYLLLSLSNVLHPPLSSVMLHSQAQLRWVLAVGVVGFLANQLDPISRLLLRHNLNLNQFCLYLFLSVLFYFLCTLALLWRCQYAVSLWDAHEAQVPERDETFRRFEVLFLDQEKSGQPSQEYMSLKAKLLYFLMRQEFIAPSFLPVFQENFLRDDFPFSAYLGECLSQSASWVVLLSDWSLVFLIGLFSFFAWVSQYIYFQLYFVVLYLLPLAFLMLLLMMHSLHSQLLFSLSQHIHSPYEFSFNHFEREHKLLQPFYLQDPLPDHLWLGLNKKQCRLFLLGVPSLHFCLLHFMLLAHSLWFVEYIFSFEYRFQENAFKFMLDIITMAVFLSQVLWLLPDNLRLLCLSTSIQQMRNRKAIQQVVLDQKQGVVGVFQSLRRLILSSRRTVLPPPSAVLPNSHENLLSKWFIHLSGNNNLIEVVMAKQLSHLAGHTLEPDQVHLLVKHCSDHRFNIVQYQKTNKFSQQLHNETGLNTQDQVEQGLSMILFAKVPSYQREHITIKQLRLALLDNRLMHNHLVDRALHEVKYLSAPRIGTDIRLIASLVADLTHGLPK